VPPASRQVKLNVYDLSPVNEYAQPLGLGVFHTGVQARLRAVPSGTSAPRPVRTAMRCHQRAALILRLHT